MIQRTKPGLERYHPRRDEPIPGHGHHTCEVEYVQYPWKTFSEKLMNRVMKKTIIGTPVRALAGHIVGDLTEPLLTGTNKLFSNLDTVHSGLTPPTMPDKQSESSHDAGFATVYITEVGNAIPMVTPTDGIFA